MARLYAGRARTEPTTGREAHVHPARLICVITGERGSGKSTVCARVARDAVTRGFSVAGILTERVEDGQDSFRRVVDLSTAETKLFGSQDGVRGRGQERDPAQDEAVNRSVMSDPLTPGWKYESDVFAWANKIFSRSSPCDLLVFDEIGPLELLGGRGWVKALEALSSPLFSLALVVCRPGLLGHLKKRLGEVPPMIFEVTPQTRTGLPAVILDMLSACQVVRRDDPD